MPPEEFVGAELPEPVPGALLPAPATEPPLATEELLPTPGPLLVTEEFPPTLGAEPEPDELPAPGAPPATGELPPTTVALPGAEEPDVPLGPTTVTAEPVPPDAASVLEELPPAAPGAAPVPGVEVPVVTFAPEPTTEPDPPLPEGEFITLPAEPPSTAEDSFWQTPSLSKV